MKDLNSCNIYNNEDYFSQNEDNNNNGPSKMNSFGEEKFNGFNKYNLNKNNCQQLILNNKINEIGTKATTNILKNNDREELKLIKNELTNSIFLSNEYDKQKTNELNNIQGRSAKKRGRRESSGEHNKFSDDNLRRKCKHIVLENLLFFLNCIIRNKYKNNIGTGINVKKLLIIKQKQISDATIQFNKDFLSKTIGDIFSDNISTRYTNYPLSHNKNLIFYLTNQRDENKKQYFEKIFNLTFLDCLKHFRGSQYIEELDGLKGFDTVKSKYRNDEDYLKSLNYYIMNFEQIINKKKARKNKIIENEK